MPEKQCTSEVVRVANEIPDVNPTKERCHVEFARRGLVVGAESISTELLTGSPEVLGAVLELLEPDEAFAITISVKTNGSQPVTQFSVKVRGKDKQRARSRRQQLSAVLDSALNASFPSFKCTKIARKARVLAHHVKIIPAGQRLDVSVSGEKKLIRPQLVAHEAQMKPEKVIALPALPGDKEHIALALKMFNEQEHPARLTLSLQKRKLNAPTLRRIINAHKSLIKSLLHGEPEDMIIFQPARKLLSALASADTAWRIDVEVESAAPSNGGLLDLLSLGFYGSVRDRGNQRPAETDLRFLLPREVFLKHVLPAAIAIAPAHAIAHGLKEPVSSDGVLLGLKEGDTPLRLSVRDRARHLYIIGATGTGKSTLIANIISDDIEAGHGVVLFDPHGDLWEDVRRLVPESRKDDLVLCHLADPRWAFTANILAGMGGDPRIERNTVANALIDLFKRVLYPGVPEAFGPMFEAYFRNALLLMMTAEGDGASLMDFQRIFTENDYRHRLISRCDDDQVCGFWNGIAEEVSFGHDISLQNVAPYIVSKLTQITGNPLLRPILAATGSSLDFREVIAERKICLINLAKGHVGGKDAAFAGGLLSIRLAMAAQAQARLPRSERRECFVFMDEFQTYATYMLADLMAESRKFGLRVTLANQTLSQISGGRQRENIAADILGNAANLVSFRVGDADARVLQNWFEPHFDAGRLKRLPDHHAVVRQLVDGHPVSPALVKTPPPYNRLATGESGG